MLLKTFEVVDIVLAALVAGVFWGPWVGLTRSIADFEPATFLVIGRRLNANLGPLMTVLMPLTLLAIVPTLVLSFGTLTFALTSAGLVSFVVAIVVTVVIEVPIAEQVKSWTPTSLPENWRGLRDRWARVHVVRVAAGIAGLACIAAGAVFG